MFPLLSSCMCSLTHGPVLTRDYGLPLMSVTRGQAVECFALISKSCKGKCVPQRRWSTAWHNVLNIFLIREAHGTEIIQMC